jgi:hypothetical protein
VTRKWREKESAKSNRATAPLLPSFQFHAATSAAVSVVLCVFKAAMSTQTNEAYRCLAQRFELGKASVSQMLFTHPHGADLQTV